jgi:outer membrane autotransporter protein
VNGQGSFGDQDATSREPGFDFHTAGVTAGADYRFTKELILGLAGGYVSTTSNLDASAGEFTAHGASVSVFGTYYIGQSFYADLIATYGWNGYETTRRIGFDSVTASANGDTDGRQVAVSVGGGYDARLRAWTLGLHGRVNYVNVRIDGFQESGAGLFDLNVDQQTIESLTTVLGVNVSYAISLPWGVLLPQVTAEWEHQYLNDSRIIDGTLVADPTQSALGVPTNTPDRNYFNLGAGVSATFGRGFSAFVYYETVLGEQNFTVHSFTGGIRYEF